MAVCVLITQDADEKKGQQSVVVASGLLHVCHVIDRNVIHDLLRRNRLLVK